MERLQSRSLRVINLIESELSTTAESNYFLFRCRKKLLKKLFILGKRLLPSGKSVICVDFQVINSINSDKRIQRNIVADFHTQSIIHFLHQSDFQIVWHLPNYSQITKLSTFPEKASQKHKKSPYISHGSSSIKSKISATDYIFSSSPRPRDPQCQSWPHAARVWPGVREWGRSRGGAKGYSPLPSSASLDRRRCRERL